MLWPMNRIPVLVAGCLCASLAIAQAPRDHERARDARAKGEHVALAVILADAEAREPGKVIDVELEDHEYEIEVLRRDGVVVELEYDARTGRLLEIEVEEDDD
jgi:uncharacterized membrane protein YkoI